MHMPYGLLSYAFLFLSVFSLVFAQSGLQFGGGRHRSRRRDHDKICAILIKIAIFDLAPFFIG